MQTNTVSVRKLTLCALFAALTVVCSQLAIPTPWGVPINLALFAVYLSGSMLGPVWGAASQAVFLGLAAIGLPVMAGFRGGLAALAGPTGGYAVGYVLAALIIGAMSVRERGFGWLYAAMVLGSAGCYLFGTLWYMALTHIGFAQALLLCVAPYLPGDAVKIALAASLTRALDKRLPRRP